MVNGECKNAADLSDVERKALDIHNKLRAKHEDTPELCYGLPSSVNGFKSQTFASELAVKLGNGEAVAHSRGNYGENLARGVTAGNLESEGEYYVQSAHTWYNEIKDWDFDNPNQSNYIKTGHYSQVVWKSTFEINCGFDQYKTSFVVDGKTYQGSGWVVVCQYYTPGNFQGQYEENVRPLKPTTDDNDNNDSNNDNDNNTDNDSDNTDNNTCQWDRKDGECKRVEEGRCVQVVMFKCSCSADTQCGAKPAAFSEVCTCPADNNDDNNSNDDNNGNDDSDEHTFPLNSSLSVVLSTTLLSLTVFITAMF